MGAGYLDVQVRVADLLPCLLYTSLAAREAELEGGPEYLQAKEFFAKLLDGRDGDCLPVRDEFGEKPEQGWLEHEFRLDELEFRTLRERLHVSTTGFFTAVMGFLVAKYNYRDDSVIATVYDGRRLPESRGVFSMLVKTLPLSLIHIYMCIRDRWSTERSRICRSPRA